MYPPRTAERWCGYRGYGSALIGRVGRRRRRRRPPGVRRGIRGMKGAAQVTRLALVPGVCEGSADYGPAGRDRRPALA